MQGKRGRRKTRQVRWKASPMISHSGQGAAKRRLAAGVGRRGESRSPRGAISVKEPRARSIALSTYSSYLPSSSSRTAEGGSHTSNPHFCFYTNGKMQPSSSDGGAIVTQFTPPGLQTPVKSPMAHSLRVLPRPCRPPDTCMLPPPA